MTAVGIVGRELDEPDNGQMDLYYAEGTKTIRQRRWRSPRGPPRVHSRPRTANGLPDPCIRWQSLHIVYLRPDTSCYAG